MCGVARIVADYLVAAPYTDVEMDIERRHDGPREVDLAVEL